MEKYQVIVADVYSDKTGMLMHRRMGFVALPAAGQKVLLPLGAGDLAFYEVVWVEHHPVMMEPDNVVAEWRKEQGPDVLIHVIYSEPFETALLSPPDSQ